MKKSKWQGFIPKADLYHVPDDDYKYTTKYRKELRKMKEEEENE